MKIRKLFCVLLTFIISFSPALAQMDLDGQVVFGHEWIDYDRSYLKFTISEDGVYRVSGAELQQAGFDLSQFTGQELQLVHWGKQVPIYLSSNGQFGPDDYLEFVGRKNTGELDKQLYPEWETTQLNLAFSHFSDKAAYFLSWESGTTDNARIEEAQTTVDASLPVESYHAFEEEVLFTEVFVKPSYTENVRYSHFDIGEGFGSGYKRTHNITFSATDFVENTELRPQLKFRSGTNATTHNVEVSFAGLELYTEQFSGYKIVDFNEQLSSFNVAGDKTLTIHGSIDGNDKYVLAHASLTYPRAFTFGSADHIEFTTRETAGAFNISMNKFDTGSNEFVVIDEVEKKRYLVSSQGGNINFTLADGAGNRNVHVYGTTAGHKKVDAIVARDFVNYTLEDPTYVILTSEKLNTATGTNSIRAYADYRASEIGGSYATYAVNIEQLYDQFAFGIERNPISVRNFAHFIKIFWTELEHMFIVGKGVEYASYRKEDQINDPTTPLFYVPTWGFPGSDNLLLAEKGFSAPMVSVGRIAARDAADVTNYLNKVIDHDLVLTTPQTPEERNWTKEIIHLSGGDPNIQENLYQHLSEMERIIEESEFGAQVTTFRKSSADPLQSATSSQIIDQINSGKAIITFFGHSGVGTFDFSLEDVGEWQNDNKLPLVISLGCHSGNIHGTSSNLGLSESFVLEPEKGAILFLASSSSAFISPQAVAGKSYYGLFGNENYGKPVGASIQDYLVDKNSAQSLSVKSLNQQLTFHGDPAIKFFTTPGPDYLVDKSSIATEPQVITTTDEVFTLSFDVLNLGANRSDSINVRIDHYGPTDDLIQRELIRIETPAYKSSVEIALSNPGDAVIGKNRIDIELDYDNAIVEWPDPESESNNLLSNITEDNGHCFFIRGFIAKPVYPSNFGIVPNNKAELIATNDNLFLEETEYRIEIDTSELFLTPLETTEILSSSGTIRWSPDFELQENTVYYWRISPKAGNTEFVWSNSSFVYLPDSSPGWNQSHYYQYLYDDLSEMEFENRKLDFKDEFREVTLNLFVPDDNTTITPAYINNNSILDKACLECMPSDGISVLVRNPVNLGWTNNPPPGMHGSFSNGQTSRVFFFETQTQESINTIINSEIDPNLNADEWALDSLSNGNKNIFNVLEAQGAEKVRNLENGIQNYALFYTKNKELLVENISVVLEEINLAYLFRRDFTSGYLTSTKIGPARSWQSLSVDIGEQEDSDIASYSVLGVSNAGDTTKIYEDLTNPNLDLSEIPSSIYPYLLLEFYAEDGVNRTATDLDFWRINYQELPEAIFLELNNFESELVNRGQSLKFNATLANITQTDMDSVLVKYSVINTTNQPVDSYIRHAELAASSTIALDFIFDTSDLGPGDYSFVVEVNPDDDQVEQYHYNNFAYTNFRVDGDYVNPVLEVRFDDKIIQNGADVSPEPTIQVSLIDDNSHFVLNDINDFEIALFEPDGVRSVIDLNNDSRISFSPGTETNNVAHVYFTPTLAPGEYILVAQAKDQSNNFSGQLEYNVSFVVTGDNKIEDVEFFPNPTADNLYINFNATGNGIPQSLSLEFYNSIGQRIYSLSSDQLQYLTIGENLIEIDQQVIKDKFTQGVYFFRFNMEDGDRSTFGDNYIGKNAVYKFIVTTNQ